MAIEYLAGDRLEETLNIINERLTKLWNKDNLTKELNKLINK